MVVEIKATSLTLLFPEGLACTEGRGWEGADGERWECRGEKSVIGRSCLF